MAPKSQCASTDSVHMNSSAQVANSKPVKQPTASSKPAKSLTMAHQVSQQVPEAVADSDMGKHTGQENGPSIGITIRTTGAGHDSQEDCRAIG